MSIANIRKIIKESIVCILLFTKEIYQSFGDTHSHIIAINKGSEEECINMALYKLPTLHLD